VWGAVLIFFIFMVLVWWVVDLLFRFMRKDTIKFDQNHLWENSPITKKEMNYPEQKKE
jgi:hypothetical protein